MVLYDTIDMAGPGAALPEQYIGRDNVIMLAELAHSFDAPFLHQPSASIYNVVHSRRAGGNLVNLHISGFACLRDQNWQP
jgi:hypothetical protein